MGKKMKIAIFAVLASAVSAFVVPSTSRVSTSLSATDSRRNFVSSAATAAAAAVFASVPSANAIRDYENVAFLGGGEIIDINNANIRVYVKLSGMYPSIAGLLVKNGPYSSVGDIYNIKNLSNEQKTVLKKYENKFTVKPPAADYVIDKFNNGMYRKITT